MDNLSFSLSQARPVRPRRWVRPALGLILSLGVMVWLTTVLDLRQVLLALGRANYAWVSLALLVVLLTLWARVRRWHALLNSTAISPAGTLQALVIGQLLNLILPVRMGDLGRAYLITQRGYPSQAQALGTVAVEKVWDIALLISLIAGLTLWQPLPTWLDGPIRLTAASGGLLALAMVALVYVRLRISSWGPQLISWTGLGRCSAVVGLLGWLAPLSGRLLDGLEGIRRPQVMLAAGSWSVLTWFFGAITNLALLKAFSLPSSMGLALFLLAVLQLGVAVPSVPGRFGIFEGLCLISLAIFGVEVNVALAYGVMLHAVVLLPPVALGLWWFIRAGWPPRQQDWP